MESIELIQYKYKNGVYGLEDMIKFVKQEIISKQQFFEVTRYNFDGVIKNYYGNL